MFPFDLNKRNTSRWGIWHQMDKLLKIKDYLFSYPLIQNPLTKGWVVPLRGRGKKGGGGGSRNHVQEEICCCAAVARTSARLALFPWFVANSCVRRLESEI
jgi:hypothetical protein